MPSTMLKDPDSRLPFGVDWTAWAAAEGDTLTESTWVIEGADADPPVDGWLESDTETLVASLATIWLTGGTAGTEYDVTNHITTAGGREDDRTIHVRVAQR